MPGIGGRFQIRFEVGIILFKVSNAVEIFLFNILDEFFLGKIVDIDGDSVFLQPESPEVLRSFFSRIEFFDRLPKARAICTLRL